MMYCKLYSMLNSEQYYIAYYAMYDIMYYCIVQYSILLDCQNLLHDNYQGNGDYLAMLISSTNNVTGCTGLPALSSKDL